MKYIDWYYERTHNKGTGKNTQDKKYSGYRYWKDLVTETQYYISDTNYNRIYKTGKEMLETYKRNNDLKAIEDIFYHSGGKADLDLFPDLPDVPDSSEITVSCARLRDYICFRTACLYALKYDSIKQYTEAEQKAEKRKIRLQGFTWKITDDTEKVPELEQIDRMLKGINQSKSIDSAPLDSKADLIKGGLVKIKQYYLETNKIPEIRGASLLLEMVNCEKMKEIICQEHIRECLIYAGGGKIMGIFPDGCGTEICRKIELMVEEETVTAQSNFYSRSYGLSRLITDYQNIVDEMDLALEERQGLRWDFRMDPQVIYKKNKSYKISDGYQKISKTGEVFCTSCRNRYAVVEYKNKKQEEKLCPSCFYKRLAGGTAAKRSVRQKYLDFIEKRTGKKPSTSPTCNTLEDIAGKENGFIGVIYGDANSMSRQINKLKSFMMMRYFSEITADTVTDIVFEALYKHLGEQQLFEIIAIGGDDIFLIVPGQHAYDIACTIGASFDNKFQNLSENTNKMTMSMGVCITHCNLPVQYTFEIAQELLKSSKQKAWEIEQKKEGNVKKTGTIDWMVIENETTGSAVLEYQRRGADDKPDKTLRPYTWKQADAMKSFIQTIKNEKSFAFQLTQSWYKHTKEEAELFYEHQLSKKRENLSDNAITDGRKICRALEILSQGFDGKAEKNNVRCQDRCCSPWLDAVELWDYVEDKNEKNRN